MTFQEEFVSAIRAGLAAQALSAHAAAKRSGLPLRSFQNVLEGRSPSLNRMSELCNALGLELYVGVARTARDEEQTSTSPTELLALMAEFFRALPDECSLASPTQSCPLRDAVRAARISKE